MTRSEVEALKRELLAEFYPDRYVAKRVAERFALKFVPKETKESKVERLSKFIREKTGLSGSMAKSIADTLVRSGRDIEGLAAQKGWPIEDGIITGPDGKHVEVQEVRQQLDKPER